MFFHAWWRHNVGMFTYYQPFGNPPVVGGPLTKGRKYEFLMFPLLFVCTTVENQSSCRWLETRWHLDGIIVMIRTTEIRPMVRPKSWVPLVSRVQLRVVFEREISKRSPFQNSTLWNWFRKRNKYSHRPWIPHFTGHVITYPCWC